VDVKARIGSPRYGRGVFGYSRGRRDAGGGSAGRQGQSWFPPHMLEETFKLAQQAIRSRPGENLLQGLTTREREIALAVSDGKSNRQVAEMYAISEATVKTHLTNIFRKLDVSDRVGLVLLLKRG
jgi:DNA-binding NarL/FixJ family response regulator